METILQRLMAIDGVTGALLVGKDGLVVASTMEGEDEELLAAMAAAAYDSAGRYVEQTGLGTTRHVIFEMGSGTIQITDAGDLLLIVRGTEQANIGRIRIEMAQASLRLGEQAYSY